MNNKFRGSKFEGDFAKLLAENGFWARRDKGGAQTCDIIAARHNKPYLFECKVCKSDYFSLDRVEENQKLSRKKYLDCGNENAWFVYLVEGIGIYLSENPIRRPSEGIQWEVWCENLHKQ